MKTLLLFIVVLSAHLSVGIVCHGQPQRTWTLWEHGTLFSPEDPTQVASTSMSDGTTVFYGHENTSVLFHVPLSNPSAIAGQSSRLFKIRILFKTEGNAEITDLKIYGGKQLLKTVSSLNLSGDFSLPALQHIITFDPAFAVNSSINIRIAVQFGARTGTQLPMINFVALGGDFQRIALGEVHVYDAQNRYVGVLVGHRDETEVKGIHVFVPKISKTILLDKETGDVGHCPGLYYYSYDCSGPAYSDCPKDIIYKATGVKGYYYVPSGRLSQTYIGSYNYYGYCYSKGDVYDLGEAVEILKATIPFELPLALPLQYKFH